MYFLNFNFSIYYLFILLHDEYIKLHDEFHYILLYILLIV